jgi:hypothetical protein
MEILPYYLIHTCTGMNRIKKHHVEVLQRNVNSLYMVVRAYEEVEVQFHTFLMLPLLSTDQNKICGLEWTRAMLLVGGVNSHLPPILLADIFCLWWTVHAYEWSASHLGYFTPVARASRCWAVLVAGRDTLENTLFCSCPESNHNISIYIYIYIILFWMGYMIYVLIFNAVF